MGGVKYCSSCESVVQLREILQRRIVFYIIIDDKNLNVVPGDILLLGATTGRRDVWQWPDNPTCA